jgi:probable O-glycosylation ligase (exosortase A-associated)
MLRILFVTVLLAIGARYSLKAPFYTLLFYLFLAYFRPETWIWSDILASANVSYIVGVWVVLYAFISRPNLNVGFWPLVMVAFLIQALISALLSEVSGPAMVFWQEFAKTIIIGYLCVVLIDDEKKLRLALLVIAFSLGFEGTKQGWTTLILSPGSRNTNGWPNLGDNNGVGIGMLMLTSLFAGLASTAPHWIERYAERFFLIGVSYRAFTTYSRGAFLSAGALLVYLVLGSRRKLVGIIATGLAVWMLLSVMPAEFWDRMGTIQTSATAQSSDQVESSAAGRLHFWQVAMVMAERNPVFGVGPWAFNLVYDRYDFSGGDFGRGRSVHSAWFGLLAETGYIGLALVILMLAYSAFVALRARSLAKRRPDARDLGTYATAIFGALIVAVVGGTFYPFQYMEPLWHCLALSMVVGRLVDMKARNVVTRQDSAPRAPEPKRIQVRTEVQLPKISARSMTP